MDPAVSLVATSAASWTREVWTSRSELPKASSHSPPELMEGREGVFSTFPHGVWESGKGAKLGQLGEGGDCEGWVRCNTARKGRWEVWRSSHGRSRLHMSCVGGPRDMWSEQGGKAWLPGLSLADWASWSCLCDSVCWPKPLPTSNYCMIVVVPL